LILLSAPRTLLTQVRWSFTGRVAGSGCAQRIIPSSAPPIVPGTSLSWKVDSPYTRHCSNARIAMNSRPMPINGNSIIHALIFARSGSTLVRRLASAANVQPFQMIATSPKKIAFARGL
jgi:hypothetical protein